MYQPLLQKRAASPGPRRLRSQVCSWITAYSRSVIVALLCMVIGVVHPFAAEGAKSAQLIVCTAHPGGFVCTGDGGMGWDSPKEEMAKFVMPFFPVTFMIVAQCSSIVLSFLIEVLRDGSLIRTARRVLRPRAILRLWPVGLAYGIADLLQTVAANSASAPVLLVIGQCKMLVTAIVSVLFLRNCGPQQWSKLVVITCAAMAGTCCSASQAGTAEAAASEFRGAELALLKAVVSATGAVFAEGAYKETREGFFVISVWVQLMMLVTSVLVLPLTGPSGSLPPLPQFFSGGPGVLCATGGSLPCDPELTGGRCDCYSHLGWDHHTVMAVAAIICNGLVTGLTLKHLSAVAKAACGTLSVAVFYVAYICLGYKPFNLTQACAITIIIVTSYEYAAKKARLGVRRNRARPEAEDAPRCKMKMEPSASDPDAGKVCNVHNV